MFWNRGTGNRGEAEEENKNRFSLQQELLKRHQRLKEVGMLHVNIMVT